MNTESICNDGRVFVPVPLIQAIDHVASAARLLDESQLLVRRVGEIVDKHEKRAENIAESRDNLWEIFSDLTDALYYIQTGPVRRAVEEEEGQR